MRPISLLHHDLPAHLHLVEDPDILALVCTRCGDVAHFSAAGATWETIQAEATSHRCPPAPIGTRPSGSTPTGTNAGHHHRAPRP